MLLFVLGDVTTRPRVTEPMPLTGLLLGAGASVEVGLPLVGELTEELKNELTPDKLRELNAGWRAQGTGYPDTILEDFASVLVRDEMHYESLLGYLETQSRRFLSLLQPYHGLYSLVVEVVYHILRLRHALCMDMNGIWAPWKESRSSPRPIRLFGYSL
jgi:hypothetical protein